MLFVGSSGSSNSATTYTDPRALGFLAKALERNNFIFPLKWWLKEFLREADLIRDLPSVELLTADHQSALCCCCGL